MSYRTRLTPAQARLLQFLYDRGMTSRTRLYYERFSYRTMRIAENNEWVSVLILRQNQSADGWSNCFVYELTGFGEKCLKDHG
jgi:hypothetical protein